jgi:hypothetical protein
MRTKSLYLFALLALLALAGSRITFTPPAANAAPDLLTGSYTLMGYEGIGTMGENTASFGPTPPIGDYVTTHCRYINVAPLNLREYYLRYVLHLPDGASITQVSAYVADYAEIGSLTMEFRSRPWNSWDSGIGLGGVGTGGLGVPGDITITTPSLDVAVDNQTTQYWLDVFFNQQEVPGQLCVYGIQVTYTYDGNYLPLIRKGG